MRQFNAQLNRTNLQPLNGKMDPFDVVSSVTSHVGNAHDMMVEAGVLGWDPELIPLSGMDSKGNIHTAPDNCRGIVVPQFPGGAAYFGQASERYPVIVPERIIPLVDAIAGHGNPLTGIDVGPTTRFFFDSKFVELTPYSEQAKALVGEVIKMRWQVDLPNTGRAAMRVGQKGQRLWCANGCTTDETMGSVTIHHSNLAPAKIDALVRKIMQAGDLGLDKWIADARRAISTRMTLEQALENWTALFKWEDGKEKGALTRQENQVATLTGLWNAPTQTITYPNTAWAFFNATTEYLDHEQPGVKGENRQMALARRVVEGSTQVESIKTRAWEMALAG